MNRRRMVLAAIPAALAFPSLAAAPTGQDADLLAAVARFHACEARQVEVDALHNPSDETMFGAIRAWEDARAKVEALTPATLDGFKAKAGVLVTTVERFLGVKPGDEIEGLADPHERMSLRFARDVLAMAGGFA